MKYLAFLVLGLLVLAGVMVVVEIDFGSPEQKQAEAIVKPAPIKAPEARLALVLTHCEKITSSLDYTGTTEGSSDYRYVGGYIQNNGQLTVKFVRVQLIWRDKDDRIVETGEMFAVGETPLIPGERATFEDSKRNYLIQSCDAKILDWWVVDV